MLCFCHPGGPPRRVPPPFFHARNPKQIRSQNGSSRQRYIRLTQAARLVLRCRLRAPSLNAFQTAERTNSHLQTTCALSPPHVCGGGGASSLFKPLPSQCGPPAPPPPFAPSPPQDLILFSASLPAPTVLCSCPVRRPQQSRAAVPRDEWEA